MKGKKERTSNEPNEAIMGNGLEAFYFFMQGREERERHSLWGVIWVVRIVLVGGPYLPFIVAGVDHLTPRWKLLLLLLLLLLVLLVLLLLILLLVVR